MLKDNQQDVQNQRNWAHREMIKCWRECKWQEETPRKALSSAIRCNVLKREAKQLLSEASEKSTSALESTFISIVTINHYHIKCDTKLNKIAIQQIKLPVTFLNSDLEVNIIYTKYFSKYLVNIMPLNAL